MKLKQSVINKAFLITSKFEGAGFSNMAGNFDGQFLSYGTFQWNFGQGTLQPLFMRLFNEYQYVADNCLPEGGKWLKDAIENRWEKDWALEIQRNNRIVDPWKTALYNLGQTPEFQQIQIDATQPYIDIAISLCNRFNLYTERAFCLFFDIAIQNGGLPYYELAEIEYIDKLISIATVCANRSSSKWRNVVLSRKMCIVNGSGYVYGGYMEFEISDDSAFEEDEIIQPSPEIKKDITISEAINILSEHNIIGDTSYWIENCVTNLNESEGNYVATIIKRFVACYKLLNTYDEVLDELVSMGIIKDKNYWKENAIDGGKCNGEFVNILITRMSNFIKE